MRFRMGPKRTGPVRVSAEDAVHARHSELSVISSVDDLAPPADDSLVKLLATAALAAIDIDLSPVLERCASDELALFTRTWPGEHYRLLPALASVSGATTAVEVGTYLGQAALALRLSCPRVVTYDIVPWRDFPETLLREQDFADGIEQRIGDLSDKRYFESQSDLLREADLIFVDGPKDGAFEAKFAQLLQPLLQGTGTIVVWDDTRVMTMLQMWRDLDVPKLDATSFGHWSGTGLSRY